MPHLGVEEGEESEEEVGAYQIREVEGDVPPRNNGFFRQLNKLFNSGTVPNFIEQCLEVKHLISGETQSQVFLENFFSLGKQKKKLRNSR